MTRLLIALMCAAIGTGATLAYAAEAAAAADPQLLALKKELDGLLKERDELRRGIEQSEAVAPLRKARDDAAKAYAEAEKSDAAVASARKAQQEAMAEYDRLLMAKTASSGAALIKQKESLEEQRHGLLLQEAIVDVKLNSPHSPVQRAMEKNAELAGLAKAYRAIDPKEKAARDAGKQKYEEARKAMLATIPEAKGLEEERGKIKAALAELDKQAKEIDGKLRVVRDETRKGDDAELKAAAGKVTAAQKLAEEARGAAKLKAARDAALTAAKAVRDKVAELVAADPKGKAVNSAIEAKSAQLAELQKKARAK